MPWSGTGIPPDSCPLAALLVLTGWRTDSATHACVGGVAGLRAGSVQALRWQGARGCQQGVHLDILPGLPVAAGV